MAELREYRASDRAEVDPALAGLDRIATTRSGPRHRRRKPRFPPLAEADTTPSEIDLSKLDRSDLAPNVPSINAVESVVSPTSPAIRVGRRLTRSRSRRREVFAAIAVVSISLFILGMFGLTASCSPGV